MAAEYVETEGKIPTSFSAAVLAVVRGENTWPPTNQLYFTDRLILIHDSEDGMWGLPAGKSKKINKILELPIHTALREWDEETGIDLTKYRAYPELTLEPSFNLSRVYFSFDPNEGTASVGFIFETTLSKSTLDMFPINDIQPQNHDVIPVKNSHETDLVGVFNVYQVKDILMNWRTSLRLPKINGDQLLDWYNNQLYSLAHFRQEQMQPKITREELGFDWVSNFIKSKQPGDW